MPSLLDASWSQLDSLIFSQARDGMALLGPDQTIGEVNPAMEALTGLPREDLVGRPFLDVFQPREETPSGRLATEAGEEQDGIVVDGRVVTHWRAAVLARDGAPREVSVTYSPLTLAGQSEAHGLLVARARTSSSSIERLPADMISAFSHELRTPLTSVKGCASTLLYHRDGLDEERVRDFLRIIDEQADRLRELIDNLADLSKIESGSLHVRRRPIPLVALLEKVVEAVEARGGHLVTPLLSESLPAVDVDARRIEQALRGLVEAIAASGRPGEAVILDGEVREGEVLLSVAGRVKILPDAAGQGGEEGRLARRRLGLQLSLCRGIVAAHGGHVSVENVPDYGGVVRMTLPVAAQRPLPTSPSGLANGGPEAQRGVARRSRTSTVASRILVVDDDPRIVKFVRAALGSAGYDVRAVYDGRSALERLELESPDLILLDLILQEMDGFEVCQRIREFSTVPIVVLTAKGSGSDKVRALDLGADDYLTKPFDTAELLARVRAALRRASFGSEPEALPVFVCEQVQVDFARRRVTVRGQELNLSPTEYKVLHQLVTNAGRVLVHEELLARVWGPEYREEVEYLRSYIRHLRRKIEDDPASPHYVLTQPGVGYYFRAPQ